VPDWIVVQEIVFGLLGMAMGGGVLYGIYRTANHWIDRRHERELAGVDGAGAADVEQLRDRVEALEEISYRLHELEERVDFTERVLTRRRDQGELPPGA